jgi:hypothetical protein
MLTIAFAALLSVAPAVHTAPRLLTPTHVAPHAVVVMVGDTPLEHIERGRSALAVGDLLTAEREFNTAIRLQRADGLLSVDATYGVAQVYIQQERFRDASNVLDQLAADANLLGDAETEARVLLDVVSVKVTGHRREAARVDAIRLKELVSDVRVSDTTRKLIKGRLS